MAQQSVSVPITVSLRPETLTAFQEQIQGLPVADWLSTRCRQWLEGFKDGGVFLTPDQVRRIETTSGKPIANGADIVAAVANGSGMTADGERSFLLTLDPAFVGPYQERAKEMGRTVTELIGDMWSMALDGSWAMSLEASYLPPVFFPNFRLIQTLTGKSRPTGAEIEKAISELVQVAKAAQKQTAETAA